LEKHLQNRLGELFSLKDDLLLYVIGASKATVKQFEQQLLAADWRRARSENVSVARG
jgi:hypothetical protein